MTQKNEIYKCNICGNIVSIYHEAKGTLVCCGQDMSLEKENIIEASTEKHIPVIEKTDTNIIVKVGSINHPMEDEHYIEWIEVEVDKKIIKKFLSPQDQPLLTIEDPNVNISKASAYCNLHGLWSSK